MSFKRFFMLLSSIVLCGCSSATTINFSSLKANASSHQQTNTEIRTTYSSIPPSTGSSFLDYSSESFHSSFVSTNSQQSLDSKQDYEKMWNIKPLCQDGCIYDDKMFLFDAEGVCRIYNMLDGSLIAISQLPSYLGLLPHSNSVCLGPKYCDNDTYPLFYNNVYNNYPNNKDTYGMCFVYRLLVSDNCFNFTLIQVIKIGFSDNLNVWYDNSENIRPYGNFLIGDNKLYVYLNIFGSSITRFFSFYVPKIPTSSETVDYFVLSLDDVEETFDTMLFKFIQGGAIKKDWLYSLEGFGNHDTPSYLRCVNLTTKDILSINLNSTIGNYEPEFIDFYDSHIIIGTDPGHLFRLVDFC